MLAAADIVSIHEAALRVLARTGVLVLDAAAVALLAARGMRTAGRRVYVDEGAVERALATAPSAFTLAGRSPARDLQFGDGHQVYGTASGSAYILAGDTLRPGTLEDARDVAKLGHLSPNIGFNGDCIEPLDLPERERTRRVTHARLVLSDKACEWVATSDDDMVVAARLNEILYGAEWHHRPRAMIILNTTSPLQLSAETARILMRWARLGQPVCVTACVMGGTTGPATPAGALVVQHAEVLAALVLAQAAGEGCPFVYGGLSAMSSMRTGAVHFGTASFAQLAEVTVRLAHHCGLPVRAGAAVTDAHVPDAQAALESAVGLSVAVRSGADFLFQAAGILSSFNAISLEKFVIDDEMITLLRVLHEPFATDPEALAVDVTGAVGPGGDYLGAVHTRQHARDRNGPTFLVRETYERWHARGEPDMRAAAAREAARLLASHAPPDDLDGVVRRQLDRYCLA